MKKVIMVFTFILMSIPTVTFAQYRQVNLPDKPTSSRYKDITSEEKGFWCAFEAEGASSIMEAKPNMQFVNLSFTGGYRLNEYLRFGAGLGARMYVNNADVRNTDSQFGIPIYANIRGNFISAYDRDGVPFWSVNVGGITNEGPFVNPTIGYSFGGLRNNFLIGISYTLVRFEDSFKSKQTYSYFGLKIGYEL